MLTGITFKGKWAKRFGVETQRSFKFEPGINLLIGPNGSGKSSIINAIMDIVGGYCCGKGGSDLSRTKKEVRIRASEDAVGPFRVLKFDFEKQNPRTQSHFFDDKDSMGFQVGSMFRSHGETNRALGKGLLATDEVKGAIVLFDEPDQALDFEGVGELIESLKKCQACQILVAVHHPRIICCQDFHCVEMIDGYREMVMNEMMKLVGVNNR